MAAGRDFAFKTEAKPLQIETQLAYRDSQWHLIGTRLCSIQWYSRWLSTTYRL